MKTQQDPIALEDHEYPDWLWTVLDKRDAATDDGAQGDIFCKLSPILVGLHLLTKRHSKIEEATKSSSESTTKATIVGPRELDA